jgi:DnaJ-class molecular chaperone
MIEDKTIRMFCSLDESRPTLNNPFNVGDFTYAINGHFGIRIARRHEYDQNTIIKNIECLYSVDVNESLWIDLPGISEISEEVNCSFCMGEGNIVECPECEGIGEVSWTSDFGNEYDATCLSCHGSKKINGTCQECKGTGKKSIDINIEICSKLFNSRLLKIMHELPAVKFAPGAVEKYKPVPFKFDGGIGVIMQMLRVGLENY